MTPIASSSDTFDSEPVLYCTNCYSLKIKHDDVLDMDCCCDCGGTEMSETSIEAWESMYEKRYGHRHITKHTDNNNFPVFKLSPSQLKERMCKISNWKEIILSLYPKFPRNLNKADSILFFFDNIIHDGRFDDLRMALSHNRNR